MPKFISNGKVIDTDVGARMKQHRLSCNLGQLEVAEVMGKTKGWLSHVERGRREIPISELQKFAQKFDADYIWLLTGLKL